MDKMVLLVISILLASIFLVFCMAMFFWNTAPSVEHKESTQRFVVEGYPATSGVRVINDTQTGVKYLFYRYDRAGGMCRLVEADPEKEN